MAGYVSLQDVTKTYQMGEITIKAADGISFDVEKGEFVIVVGPSGALEDFSSSSPGNHPRCPAKGWIG